jgi:putative glutamine amidotransferase
MKPRIGLSPTPATHEDRLVDQVNRSYVDAVVRAGGLPLILPVLDPADADQVLQTVDGLLLTGGGDVEPLHYGATAVPEVHGIDPGRDAFELALVPAAAAAGIPVLGICRGAQVLNVAMGGTLVQHLPDVSDRPHCLRDRSGEPVHDVGIEAGTRLAGLAGVDRLPVNSLHHQAVDTLGSGLRAVAWADDGVVEAIEGVWSRMLGVQWHPELLPGHPAHDGLFRWLVAEADVAVAAIAPAVVPAAVVPAAAVATDAMTTDAVATNAVAGDGVAGAVA